MASETGASILALFDKLIDQIKSNRPKRTDGKPLADFVYSQLVLGQPKDPTDYENPWSPIGGASLQDTVTANNAATGAPAGSSTPASTPTGSTPAGTAPQPNPDKFKKAIKSAFKTSQMVDNMIMVSKDGAYQEYRGGGRHISFAYENIINGMQPTPMPPIAPEVQKQIDDSQKLLYEFDDEGNIVGKSKLYKNYIQNARAYAKAKQDYAHAQAIALNDSTKADTWPQDSVFYQQQVDEAWDTFKTEGAEKVERALDIIESVGVSLQDRMIAKARKIYDVWNLGLAGVPEAIPYSYVEPTHWYDPDDDHEGWQSLTVESHEYQTHSASSWMNNFQSQWESHTSSSGGGGAVGFGFGFVGADGGTSSSSSAWSESGSSSSNYQFHGDAKNLSITIEYALCDVYRPWLLGDLFYMKNWYLVNNKKNAVSDGTIDGQVGDEDKLLLMFPTQFLVIRNVKLHADKTDWGGDGETFSSMYSDFRTDSESDYVSAGGGFCIGFLTVGGHGSHNSTDSHGSTDSGSSGSSAYNYGWKFDGETLEIRGAQIIAWLSEIVPACAPLDDPGLAK
jgi:hypothetical protein